MITTTRSPPPSLPTARRYDMVLIFFVLECSSPGNPQFDEATVEADEAKEATVEVRHLKDTH